MILNNISIPAGTVKTPTHVNLKIAADSPKFPVITIGRGSYIFNAQLQSGLNYDLEAGIHNIQIGAFCSMADNIEFMIDMNHDYKSVSTGTVLSDVISGLPPFKVPRKGQILIQNDIWVGHSATIMSNVTIHSGAVVGMHSLVTKDVPPYAIVGGNPAKVLKYRFTDEQISDLLDIAWWDWSDETLTIRKKDFLLPIEEFIAKYRFARMAKPAKNRGGGTEYLFFSDFAEPYPIWKKVLLAYCEKYGSDPNTRLVIHIPADNNSEAAIKQLESVLCETYFGQGDIVVQLGIKKDESELFATADYYITNRSFETVRRSCIADRYDVETLSGVDKPLFWKIN